MCKKFAIISIVNGSHFENLKMNFEEYFLNREIEEIADEDEENQIFNQLLGKVFILLSLIFYFKKS